MAEKYVKTSKSPPFSEGKVAVPAEKNTKMTISPPPYEGKSTVPAENNEKMLKSPPRNSKEFFRWRRLLK